MNDSKMNDNINHSNITGPSIAQGLALQNCALVFESWSDALCTVPDWILSYSMPSSWASLFSEISNFVTLPKLNMHCISLPVWSLVMSLLSALDSVNSWGVIRVCSLRYGVHLSFPCSSLFVWCGQVSLPSGTQQALLPGWDLLNCVPGAKFNSLSASLKRIPTGFIISYPPMHLWFWHDLCSLNHLSINSI